MLKIVFFFFEFYIISGIYNFLVLKSQFRSTAFQRKVNDAHRIPNFARKMCAENRLARILLFNRIRVSFECGLHLGALACTLQP